MFSAESVYEWASLAADLWRTLDQAMQDLWWRPDQHRAFTDPALRHHHIPQCCPVPQVPAATGDDEMAAGVSLGGRSG
jgi:hypothetical protein